jgi:diphosphate--fructose-6-phosphate 1-phosphotransferase
MIDQEKSAFHQYRSNYNPRTPKVLQEAFLEGVQVEASIDPSIAAIFPEITKRGVRAVNFKACEQGDAIVGALRVGCVLSGGQAAGGHNVIVGLYDYIKKVHKNSQLFGFLNGPKGIFTGDYVEINDSHVDYFKNRGGFDMICSGRDKIEKPEQFEKSLKYCQSLKLDGLVVIGGDDSNTNAALLAEYFLAKGSDIRVVGCPKTIDGDLKN